MGADASPTENNGTEFAVKNRELADIFDRIGDALEFQGENPFKISAYRRAARVLRDLSEDIEIFQREGRLREIPGVGEGIARKIDEWLTTGKMKKYDEVTSDVPERLLNLLGIMGLGPKTLSLVHRELGVKDIRGLKKVMKDGSLEKLPGMGAKKVENILRGIQLFELSAERIPLGVAFPAVEKVVEILKKEKGVEQISPAGSLRRMRETVGDLDILTTGKAGKRIIDKFTKLPTVRDVLAAGETKGSVIVEGGTQMDLRVVPEKSYGAALQYFTGSKAHNVKLRGMARAKGLKLSEYGVFRGKKAKAGKTEEEVYRALKLPLIPPELREDRGEVEAALKGALPKLVGYDEIRGDLHVHSRYSDGTATIEEIAKRAKEFGYEWICICDHSKSVRYAGGLSEDRLLRQMKEIEGVNKKLKGIRVLCGIEVDILQDGSLDYADEILQKLDVVVAAIHMGFKRDVTKRMISAMQNRNVDIIAHPTGRLISSREGYDVDLDRVMEKAAETNTALEINAYFDRLDLNDVNCRKAKDLGVKLTIGSDAHNLGMLWYARLGVGVARRGWLESADVLNTYSWPELKKVMKG